MFDEPVDRDDEDEDVTVSPPIPEAYVTAHLHGGPHDGETDGPMPWAMLEIPKLDWDTDETVSAAWPVVGAAGRALCHCRRAEANLATRRNGSSRPSSRPGIVELACATRVRSRVPRRTPIDNLLAERLRFLPLLGP